MNAALKELPPARILDCTPEEYHKDPCETPSLSSSTAKKLVSESPLHAWTDHPKYGEQEGDDEAEASTDEEKKAFENGKLVHRLLLGKGEELVVVDAKDWRTNAAKAERDEAKAAGKLPVLIGRLDELTDIVEHLRERCRSYGYEFRGESEVPIEWYEQGAAGPVLCRSMLDHVFVDDGVIWDVKTCRSANPKKIARSFVENGYDIQWRAYIRALERLRPKLTGRVEFTFLFMEIKPPFAVTPIDPPGDACEIGKRRWQRAVSLWERGLVKNHWPSYVDALHVFELPRYVVLEHLGEDWVA
jgi:hypothetical protein